MTTRLVSLTFDATDPVRLARFWASALGWEIVDESGDEIGVLPTDGTQFIFVFVRVAEAKAAKNPIHLELVSESDDDQRAVVGRLLELGADHVDIGQGPESDDGTVLADPDGNELCVLTPRWLTQRSEGRARRRRARVMGGASTYPPDPLGFGDAGA